MAILSAGRTIAIPEPRLTTGLPTTLADHRATDPAMAAMGVDMDAVHALWQSNRRWVAAVILAHKPRTADLEDLLQEVAMILVSKVHTLRDEANVKAWLRVVAVNTARAAARTQRARPQLRLTDQEAYEIAEGGDGQRVELDDHAQRVMRLAAQLPEAYREPLLLKAVHGLRTRHIAEILDLPEATVDTRVSRARRMLRELLHNEEHASDSTPRLNHQPACASTRPRP